MERLAAQREIAISATLAMPDLALETIDAHERCRNGADPGSAEWVSRGERVAPLVGLSLRAGVSGNLLRQFAEPGADAPLRDALLMLAPALIQCFAALDLWTMRSAIRRRSPRSAAISTPATCGARTAPCNEAAASSSRASPRPMSDEATAPSRGRRRRR